MFGRFLHCLFGILAFWILGLSPLFAAQLSGTIKNFSDGKAISGAKVSISALAVETLSDSRGKFTIADIPVGKHVIRITQTGFHAYSYEQEFAVEQSVRVTIELKPTIEGEHTAEYLENQPRYHMAEVTVTTSRASSDHPVTFTNVTKPEILEEHYGQDTPLLLSELPNVSVYSEGGNGFGYSYLRMRGFAQDRIAVQINGVPLNDAETHEVFWIDLPDLAEDLADMQVQRGVGSSLYGPAAFGGTVNLETRTPGLGDTPMIRAEGMYGMWNTRRAMVQFQSGRVADRYGFTGRLTRMETDGYRFGSWGKLWSYYLAGARFTDHHTTKIAFYGGPEKVHLAYEGVSKDYLEGKVTGDQEFDRRFNEFQYPGEIDNFFQPHYELHDEWKITSSIQFDNSFYLFKGDGYYDQWRTDQDILQYFYHYDFPDSLPTGPGIDILRRRNVSETDWGWIPRATFEHKFGTTMIGGDARIHNAHHEGIVEWASFVPQGYGPDYRYYDYKIAKRSFSGYVHNLFKLSSRLRGMLDVQAVSHTLTMKQDALWGVHFEKTYSSVNPRVGLNYLLMDGDSRVNKPAGTMYSSLSFAQKEPRPRDIYDAQDYWSLPIQEGNASRFSPDGEYIGPSLDPEKLMNVEVGTHWQWRNARAGLNLYYIDLRDAIVPYGALDNLGVAKTINAKKTVHEGIELLGAWSFVDGLTFSGNLALTDNHFVDHTELDWVTFEPVKRDGNRIGFDPQYVANVRADYAWRGFHAALGVRFAGKQYIDNSQDEDTAVPAYTLVNLDLGYRLEKVPSVKAVELRLRVNNLFDLEYESFGWNYGEARYFVGAPRALYTTLAVEL